MSCYRAYDAEADEDGGGGDEEYEINSMGKSVSTGLPEMVAIVYIRDKNITEQWKTIKNSMYVEVRIHNI